MNFYGKWLITLSTFFCGPYAGGYFLAFNFRNMGNKLAARITSIAAIVLTLLLSITLVIPTYFSMPISCNWFWGAIIFYILFCTICTILAYFIFWRFQQKQLNKLAKGGKKKSHAKTGIILAACFVANIILYCIVGFIVFVTILVLLGTTGSHMSDKEMRELLLNNYQKFEIMREEITYLKSKGISYVSAKVEVTDNEKSYLTDSGDIKEKIKDIRETLKKLNITYISYSDNEIRLLVYSSGYSFTNTESKDYCYLQKIPNNYKIVESVEDFEKKYKEEGINLYIKIIDNWYIHEERGT